MKVYGFVTNGMKIEERRQEREDSDTGERNERTFGFIPAPNIKNHHS